MKTAKKDPGQYILNSGLLQIVDSEVKKTSAEYLCRTIPGKDKEWLETMEKLLIAFEDSDCELHFCRRYLLKNGKMVYAWHLGFKGNIATASNLLFGGAISVPTPKKTGSGLGKPKVPKGLSGRSPAFSGPDPVAPKGVKIGVITTHKLKMNDGSVNIVEEMALPHVYRDINALNKNGKGVKKIS